MDEIDAEIIDLLRDPRFDRQLFDRIRAVINARLIQGMLYLEIHAYGCTLPPDWLKTLICYVEDPPNDLFTGAMIAEVLRQEDGHILVKTNTLSPILTDPASLSAKSRVRLTSNNCRASWALQPLLSATPQP